MVLLTLGLILRLLGPGGHCIPLLFFGQDHLWPRRQWGGGSAAAGPALFGRHRATSPRPVPVLPTAVSRVGPDPKVHGRRGPASVLILIPLLAVTSGPLRRAWLRGRLINQCRGKQGGSYLWKVMATLFWVRVYLAAVGTDNAAGLNGRNPSSS